MRSIPLFVTVNLFTAASAFAAAPTTSPADFWLDRTAADIRQSLAHPTTNPIEAPIGIATSLMKIRDNDADRALLREAIDAPVTPSPDPTQKADSEFERKIAIADAHAALGDRDVAKSLLDDADKIKTSEIFELFRPNLIADVWITLGDSDRALAVAITPRMQGDAETYCNLARTFAAAGNDQKRDFCLDTAIALGKAQKDPMNFAESLRQVIDVQSAVGLFDAAEASARMMPASNLQPLSFLLIAKRCHARRDEVRTAKALSDDAQVITNLKNDQLDAYEHLIHDAAEYRETAIAADALKQIDPLLDLTKSRAEHIARAPLAAAEVGDQARLHRFLEAAEQAIQSQRMPFERAESCLRIAAAWARLADQDKCNAALDRARQMQRSNDYSYSPGYGAMLFAWIDAGHPDIAINLATRGCQQGNLNSTYHRVALNKLTQSDFDAAWDLADHIRKDEFLQFSDEARIASSQSLAGYAASAAAKIDQISEPSRRAMVDLDIASRLLGLDATRALHRDED